MNNYLHSDLTKKIIRAVYDVFDELGFGFLESVYEKALEKILVDRGHEVSRQFAIPVFFRGEQIGDFRADFSWEHQSPDFGKFWDGFRPLLQGA